MASFIYDSCPDDEARGNLDFDTNAFKAMLVTSSYVPNRATHTKRSDVTSEASGTGYTAGGTTTSVTVTKDVAEHKVSISFSSVSWPGVTLSAKGCVIYRARGGASSADELVAYVDFGSTISATGATFAVSVSTITKQL